MSAPLSYKNDSDADERLNPASESARKLHEQENDALPGYDRANDGLDDHPISAGDASGKPGDLSGGNTKNIDAVNEGEQSGGNGEWKNRYFGKDAGQKTTQTGFFKRLKGKGPIGIILTLAFGTGTLGFFGTTLMPVGITESFINDSNDMNASQQDKKFHLFGNKLGGNNLKKKMSICTKSISIRCKFNTLNEKTIEKFKKEGFTFKDETKVGGRTGFSSMKFPDDAGGAEVKSVQELENELRKTPGAAAVFSRVYSLKNSLIVYGKFIGGVLKKLNLTKAKKISGNNKEETDKSYKDAVKGDGKGGDGVTTKSENKDADKNATDAEKKAASENASAGNDIEKSINEAIGKRQKLKALKLKLSNALAIPQLACLTYNMSRYISVAAKTIKSARYITFAMIFLTLAGSIKAGTATPAEAEKATSILAPSSYPEKIEDPNNPGVMIDNPNIGKTATDSEAAQVVMHGASINLSDIAKRFIVAGGFLGVLDTIVTKMNQVLGKEKIKTACKIVNSSAAAVISFLAAPIAGTIIAGLVAVLPVEKWAADLVNLAIDAAAGADLTTDIVGVDAGNVLFIGAAGIMGTMAMKFGLKPGGLSAIKKNLGDNSKTLQDQVAVDRYNAKSTPFAIDNRYSFLGSIAYSLAGYMPTGNQPPLLSLGKFLSAIPLSLSSFTKNASAAYTMPVAGYNDTRFNQCKDEVYTNLPGDVQPDMFCVIRYVPHAPMEVDAAIDYMETNNQIDDITGNAVSGSDYEKYLKYCTDRTDPWGSTSVAAEEETDSDDWYTGVECLKPEKETQMDAFSEYTGYHITNDNIDETGTDAETTAFTDIMGGEVASNSSSDSNIFSSVFQSLGLYLGQTK